MSDMKLMSPLAMVLLVTLAIKFYLAWLIPLSGDEAYFVVWAHHPDFGYYDHPPMAGWFLQLMLFLGNSEVVLRLPAILLSTLIGIGLYRLIRPFDETRAQLAAMLYLVSPLNVLNVLITTDTPLILFAFLSAWALSRALQKNSLLWYALAGALFGMAFLSKYFAVLLGLAYLAYFVFSAKSLQKTKGFALLYLAALPFALVNLYWNYTHCWDNILFNLYNRNENEHFSPDKIATFLAVQLYLMTPPVIYYVFKHRAQWRETLRYPEFRLFAWLFCLPLTLFALLSLKRDIGLHWVLAFYPFLYVMLGMMLSGQALRSTFKFTLWFTGAHLALVAVIALMPMESWKGTNLYDGIVFMFRNDEIVDKVRPYEQQGFVLSSDGYTSAAIISYHYGKNFSVFGSGSTFARQDDMLTDFRQLNGRNVLVIIKSAPDLALYAPYFSRVEVVKFELRGVPFYFVLGYDFDYRAYKEKILRPILSRHYKIPAFLPHAPCYFCEKYFPEQVN